MSRRYDSRTTIFSPEGRLYQVEYAMEAISHAGTALGILASDGIVLAAEKKLTVPASTPHIKLLLAFFKTSLHATVKTSRANEEQRENVHGR